MKINTNIKRLSLHDSHFEKEKRKGEEIILIFDWAKLDNFIEGGEEELIIMGRTKITIQGIKNEIFRAYYDEAKFKLIDIPENLGKYWQEVANTEINETIKKIQLDGMFNKDNESYWVEWEFNYNECEIEWTNHVTLSQWKNGKLPTN